MEFKYLDKVKLKGKDNPYCGATGTFVKYETKKLEQRHLIVNIDLDCSEHYFYEDEVEKIKDSRKEK